MIISQIGIINFFLFKQVFVIIISSNNHFLLNLQKLVIITRSIMKYFIRKPYFTFTILTGFRDFICTTDFNACRLTNLRSVRICLLCRKSDWSTQWSDDWIKLKVNPQSFPFYSPKATFPQRPHELKPLHLPLWLATESSQPTEAARKANELPLY